MLPFRHRSVKDIIGVDCGTTNNLVATYIRGKGVFLVTDSNGKPSMDSTVSMVYNHNSGMPIPVCGSPASKLMSQGYQGVPNPKRLVAASARAGDMDALRKTLEPSVNSFTIHEGRIIVGLKGECRMLC